MNYLADQSGPRYRGLNLLGLATCIGSIIFAVVYLQGELGLDPCPLCMASRLVIMAMAVVFLLAWVHNPRQLGQRVYATFNFLLGIGGVLLSARHIWLQSLPPSEVPECGPGLEYLLQNFPLQDAFSIILNGSGECAEIQWSLLGLTIPQQTLLLFIALMVLTVLQFRKKKRNYFA
nr:disulfide bond formation protein B [Motiliproteus sediminis]